MMFNTDRTKTVTTKAQKDMAIVNKQRNKSSTDNGQLLQMNTDSKFTHMNNINITMSIFL